LGEGRHAGLYGFRRVRVAQVGEEPLRIGDDVEELVALLLLVRREQLVYLVRRQRRRQVLLALCVTSRVCSIHAG
jgi:hypothetical protein